VSPHAHTTGHDRHDHHGHAQGQNHSHGHPHGHPHGYPQGEPAHMASAMLMSAPARLGVAAGLVAILWGLVAWAIT
jgi:hypothetical protein